jgi:hypothetical protein
MGIAIYSIVESMSGCRGAALTTRKFHDSLDSRGRNGRLRQGDFPALGVAVDGENELAFGAGEDDGLVEISILRPHWATGKRWPLTKRSISTVAE